MNRRGAALLVVLWLLVALGGVAALALAGVRTSVRATQNRLILLRAGWAAEACLQLQAAGAREARPPASGLDSVDLGQGAWCRLTVEYPASRLHVNRATEEALHAVVGDSALVTLLLAARPLPALAALGFRQGLDVATVAALSGLLTVRGSGIIDWNRAPARVLLSLPGMDAAGTRAVVERRALRPFASVDEALSVLPPATRERVLRRYPEVVAQSAVTSPELVSRAEGHVGASPLVARVTATLVLAGNRLALLRREVE